MTRPGLFPGHGGFQNPVAGTAGDGTAIFSLLRNIGSAIGISVAQSQLVRMTCDRPCGLIENPGNNHNILRGRLAFHLSEVCGVAPECGNYPTGHDDRVPDDFCPMLIVTVVVIPCSR